MFVANYKHLVGGEGRFRGEGRGLKYNVKVNNWGDTRDLNLEAKTLFTNKGFSICKLNPSHFSSVIRF